MRSVPFHYSPQGKNARPSVEEIAERTDGILLGTWQRLDLIHRSNLSAPRKWLLATIAKYESRSAGLCYASQSLLATDTAMGLRTVNRLVRELERLGLIRVNGQTGQSSKITIEWEVLAVAAQQPTPLWRTPTYANVAQVDNEGTSDLRQSGVPLRQIEQEPTPNEAPTYATVAYKGFKGLDSGRGERALTDVSVSPPQAKDQTEEQPQPQRLPDKEKPTPRPIRDAAGNLTPEELEERRRCAEECRPAWVQEVAHA